MNPVQWASTMLDETTPCDIILLMALRDLTDVSKNCIELPPSYF